MTGYLCSARIYKYGKWTFEYGMGCFSPVTIDGSPYKRISKKFYDDVAPWLKLSDKEKEKYRVSGGCIRF